MLAAPIRRILTRMATWHELGPAGDVAEGQMKTYRSPLGDVLVVHHEGEFFAMDDGCPHQGASLGAGVFHDGRVICPLHNWVFDVKTGECPRGTHEPAHTVNLRVINGTLQIEVPDA